MTRPLLAALALAAVGFRRAPRRPGDVDALPEDVVGLRQEVAALRAEAAGAIRHLGIVRYDAFASSGSSVGGRLSWSLALLDDGGNGVVLTAIHAERGVHISARAPNTLPANRRRATRDGQRFAPR